MDKEAREKLLQSYREAKALERKVFDRLYASDDILDEDGYPSSIAIRVIELWPFDKPSKEVFDYIEKIWAMKYFGWHVKDEKDKIQYHLSTAGWSGNEAIIKAMQDNHNLLWDDVWVQSRRVGHYIFEVEKDEYTY